MCAISDNDNAESSGGTCEQQAVASTVYRIDAADIIRYVNSAWKQFARDNDANDDLTNHAVGRSLWTFIYGQATSELYRVILRHVRQNRKPVRFPYRCDSPDVCRKLEMEVIPLDNDAVEFRNTLVETTTRPTSVQLRCPSFAGDPLLARCSMCNKVKCADEWIEVDKAVSQRHILLGEEPTLVIYGVCEDCSQRVSNMLGPRSHTA